uniref:Rho GTPase-activating protein 18-like n=1 Tax=Stegastes partitus TaxID=144197 RepID=A0A3B5BJI9_9TELE
MPLSALLSTLTRQQVTTVRRRLDNYNETLKKRNRQPIRDVRDIFTEVGHKRIYNYIYNILTTSGKCRSSRPWVAMSRRYVLHSLFQPDDDSADRCPSPPSHHTESPPSRYHTTTKTIHSGVFGVPLNSLLENDKKKFPGVKVPVIFQKLLCILEQTGLQTEGILRVPGSAARLKYLRRELDRCCGAFDWSAVRQVDAAGLLKLFIRELPTPLLTHTHLSTYRSVLGTHTSLSNWTHTHPHSPPPLLPHTCRSAALLVFLRKVVFHQDQNRMSLWNVSMVMAPNLFTCRHRGNKSSIAKQREEMEEAVGAAHLIRLMITHQDLLWTVPTFLLSQVRHMNQASNQRQLGLSRTKRRLLRRRNDKNDRDQVTELCEGVIRVHAPRHAKVSMAIQLEEQMTARDVTSRFECENTPVQRLYEVGGNICERRLHPDCVLLDVYRVNPHCDWLIKP